MLMVEFSVTPLDRGESVGDFAAEAIELISRSGLKYKVGPMATTIEGEPSAVMNVISDCLKNLSKKSGRLIFNIQGDLRPKSANQIEHAVERVEEVLGHSVPQ